MPNFLIEVEHEETEMACLRAIKILQDSGSHYLTNADFGCKDGVHKAWIIVEVDSKEEARSILPPVYRTSATIVGLNKFSKEEIDDLLKHHKS